MYRLRQLGCIVGYNFRQWKGCPRIAVVFALAFVLCFLLSDKVVRFASHYETILQIGEPFIWTFGDANNILLISLLLVLLFVDMPFVSSGTPFYLSRTSRAVWMTGQIVYVCLATTLFIGFILLSTACLCAHLSFTGNQWSETAAILGYSGTGSAIALPVSLKAMQMTTPYACMAASFLLMLLYSLLLVSLMLMVNVWKGRFWGIVSVFVFSLAGFLLNPEVFIRMLALPPELEYKPRVAVGWLSPLNHATYYMHNFGYDLLPTLYQSCLIFLVAIVVMFAVALRKMRGYSFQFTGTIR